MSWAVSSENASQASRMLMKRCSSEPVLGSLKASSSGRSVRRTPTSCNDDCSRKKMSQRTHV